MQELYLAYLALLDDLGRDLESLSELARKKAAAVQKDDLAALDQILKEEQALALSLRGLEQRRGKLLEQLGLEGTSLRDLPGRYPPELQLRAKQTAEELRCRYQIYQSASQVALDTLECNLHVIEKALEEMGGGGGGGPGYGAGNVELPSSLKTDFRA